MSLSKLPRKKNFTVDGVAYKHECHECKPECDPLDNPNPTLLNNVSCEKNPGHQNFVPVKQFTKDHIKGCLNPEHLYERMLVQSRLVVRIVGRCVSPERPDNGEYLFCDKRGQKAHYHGTGIITECFCRYGEGKDACVLCKLLDVCYEQKMPCPCRGCKSLENPCSEWYLIPIITAKHVIYDNLEAGEATVNVYFDDPDDRTAVVTLIGICCKVSSDKDDVCVLLAITHDRKEFERINNDRKRKDELKAQAKLEKKAGYDKFHYIVSYPHGCSKHIAVDFKENLSILDGRSTKYKTSTCCGSSGAFIGWIDSGQDEGIGFCVHRGAAVDRDENISSSVIRVLSVLKESN